MAIIDKPSDYFNTKLIYWRLEVLIASFSGVGFAPNWVNMDKSTETTANPGIKFYDTVRTAEYW
jgi:hypothetical protein